MPTGTDSAPETGPGTHPPARPASAAAGEAPAGSGEARGPARTPPGYAADGSRAPTARPGVSGAAPAMRTRRSSFASGSGDTTPTRR